jgi:hypothetical protein
VALVGIWSRISGAVAGVAIGRAATDAVTPVYENTRQQSWARRAVRVLDPEAAAEAQAQGIDFGVDYEDDAKRNGVGKNRFLTLVAMARTYPGVSELLALWRRDPTLEDEIRLALRRQGYTDAWIDRLERLRYGVSDPGTLAQLVAVGQLTDETGRNLANTAGVSDLAFDRMVVAARNAPNMGQILDWGNRQGLTDSEVADALEVTGLRPSWRAPVAALRHYLIPPSDLIRMAVREVFSPGLPRRTDVGRELPAGVCEPCDQDRDERGAGPRLLGGPLGPAVAGRGGTDDVPRRDYGAGVPRPAPRARLRPEVARPARSNRPRHPDHHRLPTARAARRLRRHRTRRLPVRRRIPGSVHRQNGAPRPLGAGRERPLGRRVADARRRPAVPDALARADRRTRNYTRG